MDNQNTTNFNSDNNSKHITKKKKTGCLGCFGFLLLTIVIIVGVFFTIKAVNKKIEEKEEKKLKDRFSYIEKVSAEDKITQAFKKGEISSDTYILQLAYSIFETNKVDQLYKSDNEMDFAPEIIDLFVKYNKEISRETAEYIAKKLLMTDIKIHPDASQNKISHEQKGIHFSEYVYANEKENKYDVTILDKAYLSESGKFLIWYTETGNSGVKSKDIKELAYTVDNISNNIDNFLNIDWAHYYRAANQETYEEMREVLKNNGIDEKVLQEAFPIYIYETPNKDGAAAWYIKDFGLGTQILRNILGAFASEDDIAESKSVYSIPYIVIKSSYLTSMENLSIIFAHELTHHFQRIYYNDLNYYASDYTSETVANFVAASVTKNKGQDTLLNKHADCYVENYKTILSDMESNKSSGYYEFIWAKSYADIIENGRQYLKESLLQKNAYQFLCDKAGDSYQKVLEDLAVRNITKEYPEKGFISNIFPKANDDIDRYMDTISGSINANCFDYYYLDSIKYRMAQSIIQLKNNSEGKIFVKRIGRKKDNYNLIDTLYCEAGKELTVADFSSNDYKKYDEILLALGYCETSGIGNYQLVLVSEAAIDLYETVTGLKDLDPWKMNGNCITVHIEDLVEGTVSVTDYLKRALEFADDDVESQDTQESEITSEYLNYFKNEINVIGEAVKNFGDKFQYKTMRFYTIPIENSTLSDGELHDAALNMMPKPKFKILDKVDDEIHVTIGGSVQPFSNTQIIVYAVITTSQGEKGMYRIEFDK